MNEKNQICVLGRKGGVGKTTCAVALASAYAHNGAATLVVDLDPQSNVAFALGVDPTMPGAAQFMLGQKVTPQVAAQNLEVLSGGPALQEQRVQMLDPEELHEALTTLAYDAVVLDCPPGNEALERFALVASQTALVVTDAHPLGLIGASRVLEVLEDRKTRQRRGPKRWAMVMSRLDNRRAADRRLPEAIAEMYPDVPRFELFQDSALAEATATQKPMMEACPSSRAAECIGKIKGWVDG